MPDLMNQQPQHHHHHHHQQGVVVKQQQGDGSSSATASASSSAFLSSTDAFLLAAVTASANLHSANGTSKDEHPYSSSYNYSSNSNNNKQSPGLERKESKANVIRLNETTFKLVDINQMDVRAAVSTEQPKEAEVVVPHHHHSPPASALEGYLWKQGKTKTTKISLYVHRPKIFLFPFSLLLSVFFLRKLP